MTGAVRVLNPFPHSPFCWNLLQVIQKNQNLTSKTADPPSAAILALYLDQAHDLPVSFTLL